jgi:hypothetical protein
MRGKRSIPVWMAALAAVALVSPPTGAQMSEAKKTPWKLKGQLEEACSCAAACPCWFDSKPTKMTCGGGEVLFIAEGNHGSVSLNGLALGMMGESPEGKGMMESFGNWKFTNFYLDAKATPEQREALKAIATAVFSAPSQKIEYRVTPITRTIEGEMHKISLGEYGTFHGHLVNGGMGGPVRITNPPGADPLHQEFFQGLTKSMTYKDAGAHWNFEGSNYMFANFEITSEQYEKYAAGLAHKKEKAKQAQK